MSSVRISYRPSKPAPPSPAPPPVTAPHRPTATLVPALSASIHILTSEPASPPPRLLHHRFPGCFVAGGPGGRGPGGPGGFTPVGNMFIPRIALFEPVISYSPLVRSSSHSHPRPVHSLVHQSGRPSAPPPMAVRNDGRTHGSGGLGLTLSDNLLGPLNPEERPQTPLRLGKG